MKKLTLAVIFLILALLFFGCVQPTKSAQNSLVQDSNIYKQSALLHYKNKDFYGALSDLNNAIKLDPTDPTLYFDRCQTEGMLKEYTEALADCNKAIDLNPLKAESYLVRGSMYYYFGDTVNARRDIQKADDLNSLLPTYDEQVEIINIYLDSNYGKKG